MNTSNASPAHSCVRAAHIPLVRCAHPGWEVSDGIDKATAFVRSISGATAVIVDCSNVTSRHPDHIRFDHKATLAALRGDKLIEASIVVSEPATHRPAQEAFYRWLGHAGWRVYRHPLLKIDGRVKENEAAVDGHVRELIRAATGNRAINSIVLLSGDGGYTDDVRAAVESGKHVFVVAHRGTINPALAAVATGVATIEELAPFIARVGH